MKKNFCTLLILLFSCFLCTSQGNTSTIKAKIDLGINNPSIDGFVENFEGKSLNFPTVNLGIQYMLTKNFGAKLDYGFNRISNDELAQPFKLNYSRFDLQAVLDLSKMIFISNKIGWFIHAGSGYTFVNPLGDYPDNKTAYFNAIGGIEFHYGISDKLSIYTDASYILGFSDDFDPIASGFGSFNGNLLTITLGVSISLSGCYYCEQYE